MRTTSARLLWPLPALLWAGLGWFIGSAAAAPPNDNFANRAVLTGTNVNLVADNIGATKEPGEPDHAGVQGGSSVWWTWKAPSNGEVRITTDGSSFDTQLAVYVGSTLAALSVVASNDDQGTPYVITNTSRVRFEVTKDTDYQIAVDGYQGATGSINLSLNFLSEPIIRPANDNFADAIPLSGASVSVHGSNVEATHEPDEPDHAGEPGDTSVWWTWTAPAAGSVTITTAGSDFDTLLGVYTGTAVSALTLVASNDDASSNDKTSKVKFDADSGVSYHIAVDGFLWTAGQISLQISEAGVVTGPPNNDFANRAVLTGTNVTLVADNVGATKEPGEPDHAGVQGGSSVWWTWKAPSDGELRISTDGSSFDTLLGVYLGSAVTALSVVASNDNQGLYLKTSRVRFEVTNGSDYQIAVDGYAGTNGTINLSLSFVPAPILRPPNDDFANRIVLSGSSVSVPGSNVNATHEPGEPLHAGHPGDTSVWWSWTAPTAGQVTITTAGSDFDTMLAVYTGLSVSNLTLTASNDDAAPNVATSRVVFQAVAGQSYEIAVDGFLWSSGDIQLQLNEVGARGSLLSAPLLLPNGAFQFQVGGSPGLVSEIQASSDLRVWNAIGTITNTSDVAIFTDSTATNSPYRFYRALVKP